MAHLMSEEPRYYTTEDGRKLPSVTTISRILGSLEFQGALDAWKIEKGQGDYDLYRAELERAQERGKAVHAVCEDLICNVDVPDSALTVPYVVAFKKWEKAHKRMLKNKLIVTEATVFNDAVGYAGTADILLPNVLIDLKTCAKCPSKPKPQHCAQVVAYMRAAKKANGWLLYLDAEQNYRFFLVKDRGRWWRLFKAALNMFNLWQEK